MRQALLRLVCDKCGVVLTFETMNSEPLTATTNIPEMIRRHGWETGPKVGASFSPWDHCPACKELK
jgi:hypothetical protein